MTAPVPTTSGGVASLGALIGDFPPSDGRRVARFALRSVVLYITLTGAIAFIEFGILWRILLAAGTAACALEFHPAYGASAKVFEHGFIISR